MSNDLDMGFDENISSEYTEFKEKTVDDAITSACRKLMVTSDRLDYVVVDQGSSGFLGFNARPAVIKARVRQSTAKTDEVLSEVLERAHNRAAETAAAAVSAPEAVKEAAEKELDKAEEAAKEIIEEIREEAEETVQEAKDTVQKAVDKAEAAAEAAADAFAAEKSAGGRPAREQDGRHRKEERTLTEEEVKKASEKADEFLTQVFGAMGMDVDIRAVYDKNDNILTLDLAGDDMGILIGKRGQTLDSLQYLVSLVVNKEAGGYVHIKCDTENYRERRRKTLENLAKNVAFKVKRTKQNVALEPMNPYERRIIHSALQGDKFVTTYSEGEEPYRKVIVTLKK